ncbi:unnamed protein product [Hydatigera taeniaeformis]|uniref:RRM domain-containing protein n=1 Tax=Hydatigena taeniaeformis TaxID=6205 RepID=A0A3P7FBA1_HYDTA|nr:unnamed protein product [Hydatigera taeniaeformis]
MPWALQLNALIKAFRTPVNARFPMKKFKGNRKYAFLEFSSASLAKQALERGMQLKFLGRTPKCEVVSQKVQNGYLNDPWIYQLNDFKLNKLMISCIPRIATVDDIRYLFPGASNVDFPNAGPDKALGSAQVEFIEAKDALAAFKTKHGVLIHGVPIIVNYCLRKKAGKRNKEERKNANGEQVRLHTML